MKLPQEIIEKIILYTNSLKYSAGISNHMTKKLFDPRDIVNYEWQQNNLTNIHLLKWLRKNNIDGWIIYAARESAKTDNLHNLKWITKHWPETFLTEALINAVCSNHMHIVEWMFENHKIIMPFDILECAVKSNNIEMVKYIYNKCLSKCNLFEFDLYGCDAACKASEIGNLEILKFIISIGFKIEVCIWNKAAENGHLEILVWLHDSGFNIELDILIWGLPAKYGHLEILKWLWNNGYGYYLDKKHTASHALKSENINVIKYLEYMGIEYDDELYKLAGSNPDLEILKYVLSYPDIKQEHITRIINRSITLGHVNKLDYLFSAGYEMRARPHEIIERVIAYGNIHMIDYLKQDHDDIRSKLDFYNIREEIIAEGFFHVFEWYGDYILNLEDVIDSILHHAITERQDKIVYWILDKYKDKCEKDGYNKYFTSATMTTAIKYGYYDAAKILYNYGLSNGVIPQGSAFADAAEDGRIDILKWLIDINSTTVENINMNDEDGISIDEYFGKAFRKSIRYGHIETVKFLYDYDKRKYGEHHYMPIYIDDIYKTIKHGHLHMIKFLLDDSNGIGKSNLIKQDHWHDIVNFAVHECRHEILIWLYKKLNMKLSEINDNDMIINSIYADDIIVLWIKTQIKKELAAKK